MTNAVPKRLAQLRALVAYHQHKYHTEDVPEISDEAYDALVRELAALELDIQGSLSDTTTQVGGTVSTAFQKVTHVVRQWSFDNVFSLAELKAWEERLMRVIRDADVQVPPLTYVAEHKIDGLKLIVHYKAGRLTQAVTRGDGEVGEDVTHTARTISTLPERLKYPVDLIAVGEVWLAKAEFERINTERAHMGEALFANPRNAAAGTLRQLDPAVAQSRQLAFFAYDIDFFASRDTTVSIPQTQWEELALLHNLGLPTNEYPELCADVAAVERYYEQCRVVRDTLPYGIDGVVVKVNDITTQQLLGYTAKAPRFGIAYKLPATQTTTIVEAITLQVGRTGVVTPVAELRPVLIAGSTVSRATLHNADQIDRLDVRVGDTVIIQKAGDVIPEVVAVVRELRPSRTKPFCYPAQVSECGGDGVIFRRPGEVAFRCASLDSPYIHRLCLHYAVSKVALNIDGVGPKVIDSLLERGLIRTLPDLFRLTKEDFLQLPLFRDKAAENAVAAIQKARTQSLSAVLISLSIEQVGEETARLLARQFGSLARIRAASLAELEAVHGIGTVVAREVYEWFQEADNQAYLNDLESVLTILPESTVGVHANGLSFVLTGTLSVARDEVKQWIRDAGGTIVNSVSKKTSYVVVGENPGSKLADAKRLGVPLLSEEALRQLLNR